jgi:diaminopimelate epimerase
VRFAKAHAYGNDFIYVDERDAPNLPPNQLARDLCDRHFGIGADGLILFSPTPTGARMRLLNADGSPAEVSGNGVRGLAALLLRHDLRAGAELTIETDAGRKRLTRTAVTGSRQTFRASMGLPLGLRSVPLEAVNERLQAVVLDFGNPQCVILGNLPDDDRFHRLGPAIERHAMFPAGTNVEFALVEAPDRIRIRIWERGVGPTESSGTGSCASLIAAASYGGAARNAEVLAPGGSQRVEWRDDSVYLTGWAEVVFEGDWLRPAESSYERASAAADSSGS